MSHQRVVIFTRDEFPHGSAGLRVRMWAHGLRANQTDTSIIVAYPPPTSARYDEVPLYVRFSLPVREGKIGTLLSIYYKWKGTFAAGRILEEEIKGAGGVLLYGIGYLEGLIVSRICRKYGVKFFAERCDETRQLYYDKRLRIIDRLALMNDSLFDKLVLKRVNVLFTVSSYLETKYKEIGKTKVIRSLPTFVDLEMFDALKKNDIRTLKGVDPAIFMERLTRITYAGSCIQTNGIMFFLKCAATLIAEGQSNFRIVLALTKGEVEDIRKYCFDLGIQDKVTIFEGIPFDYIPSLYEHSDILVLPEMGDVIANAGFPGKTGEYLASGKAIIATIFSDLTDYLTQEYNAMLSPLRDEVKYANNLRRLILDDNLREKLGRNARTTAREYFDCAKAVLPLIQEL